MQSNNMRELTAELLDISAPEELARDWLQLQKSADCDFFQTWSWAESWYMYIVSFQRPRVFKVFWQGQLVAVAFLHSAVVTRRKLFRRKLLFLNELPTSGHDMIVEYNGMLCRRGFEKQSWSELLGFVYRHENWDEFHLNYLSDAAYRYLDEVIDYSHFSIQCEQYEEVHYMDFSTFDDWAAATKGLLSKNRRAQLRRTLNKVEALAGGRLHCEVAANVSQALSFFEEMGLLHTEYWHKRGQGGAFSRPDWVSFHHSIIRHAQQSEEGVQLIKLQAGELVIGYLYNVVWGDRVYNLQSGINSSLATDLQLGYISHMLVAETVFNAGYQYYDLLPGAAQYKSTLCNQTSPVRWLRLRRRRDRWKFFVEDALLDFVRKARAVWGYMNNLRHSA